MVEKCFLKEYVDIFRAWHKNKINFEEFMSSTEAVVREYAVKLEESGWKLNIIEGGMIDPTDSAVFILCRDQYVGQILPLRDENGKFLEIEKQLICAGKFETITDDPSCTGI